MIDHDCNNKPKSCFECSYAFEVVDDFLAQCTLKDSFSISESHENIPDYCPVYAEQK